MEAAKEHDEQQSSEESFEQPDYSHHLGETKRTPISNLVASVDVSHITEEDNKSIADSDNFYQSDLEEPDQE